MHHSECQSLYHLTVSLHKPDEGKVYFRLSSFPLHTASLSPGPFWLNGGVSDALRRTQTDLTSPARSCPRLNAGLGYQPADVLWFSITQSSVRFRSFRMFCHSPTLSHRSRPSSQTNCRKTRAAEQVVWTPPRFISPPGTSVKTNKQTRKSWQTCSATHNEQHVKSHQSDALLRPKNAYTQEANTCQIHSTTQQILQKTPLQNSSEMLECSRRTIRSRWYLIWLR